MRGYRSLVKPGTGATYMVMELEVRVTEEGGKSDFFYLGWPELLYRPAKVDRVLHDGDQVKLGGSVLTAHLSGGHTKGCTKWTIVGSPNVNAGFRLVNNTKYPRIAEDYSRTFEVLRSLQCAIFLGAHRDYYGLERKFRRYGAEGSSVFIDPDGYGAHVAEREKAFRQEWDRQKK